MILSTAGIVRRAVRQRADRLRAADRERCGRRRRAPRPRAPARCARRPGVGVTMTISPTPATFAGDARSSAPTTDRRPCRRARRCRRDRAASPSGRAGCRRRRDAPASACKLALVEGADPRRRRTRAPRAASAGSAASAACGLAARHSSAARRRGRPAVEARVYSSTAASPRARTSARISAVTRSSPSSCAALEGEQRARARRRIRASLLERGARGSATGSPSAPAPRSSGAMAVALQLQRRLVDDQAARDRHDLLDHAQAVGLAACCPWRPGRRSRRRGRSAAPAPSSRRA